MKTLSKSIQASVLFVAPINQGWPNLDVLAGYPNPAGTTCSLKGKASSNSEKARSNRLKNRYRLHPNGIEPMLLSDFFKLPSGKPNAPPKSGNPNHSRFVSVVGFVRQIARGGTRCESCNCGATGKSQVDVHIEIVLDPNNNNDPEVRGMVVAEVTERGRRLASQGLLTSNIGNDWSYQVLRGKLLGRWVKFTGWAFYDADHHKESWQFRSGRQSWPCELA